MPRWDVTKARAEASLTVWRQHFPDLRIGKQTPDDLGAMIEGFEPLLQAAAVADDGVDAAERAVEASLALLKLLGSRVPQIIEGQLGDDTTLMRALRKVYQAQPQRRDGILARARRLHPVWVRADAVLAAMSPPEPPITRRVGTVSYTAALFLGEMQDYTELAKAMSDARSVARSAKQSVELHAKDCDSLIKRWYRVAKANCDPGTPERAALGKIRTEPGTPMPVPIEIAALEQTDEDGRGLRVSYAAGGGAHATRRLLRWQVVNGDDPREHEVPLDLNGNFLGAFSEGDVVSLWTEVANSSGRRSGSRHSITIAASSG